ncbi:A disintegrin and metalloproteinase with thrombospondin motifs adt-2-like isoform X1 [Rhodnius prolixus]
MADGSNFPTDWTSSASCIYTVRPPLRGVLNLCNGISGFISTEGTEFIMNPLPRRLRNLSIDSKIPHVIIKRSTGNTVDINGNNHWLQRKARYPPVHIETAIFVDSDLYNHMGVNFPKDTERQLVNFVLTMVNAVQLLYHDPSLGRAVTFVVKRLEILHVDPAGLTRSADIDRYLGSFCTWQGTENPPGDSDPSHWDHALMLTGLDLYVLSKNGKVSKQVVGLAPVAGMCNPTSSCTVNEGRHFESVYVVAHEIGHNLGMRHDGPLADNNCDPGSYLMSPTLGSGKITWSSCSRQYLNQFLRTPQSHCLMDHNSSGAQLDHGGLGKLPGERFNADEQCMLKYGRGSKHASTQSVGEICHDLHCSREGYTWTSHPALEGTSCGSDKWCRSGRCVGRNNGHSQSGGWSDWSPYSECASACLSDDTGHLSASTGVMVATRLCNSPRPENGGDPCVGSDKKYKMCVPYQCSNIPKTSIRNFASEVCMRAKEVDADLTGTGIQKISSSPEEACTVWCHRRSGGYVTKGWTFPDGTSCQTHHKPRLTYCISGLCQEFKCGNNEEDVFLVPAGLCKNSVFFSRDKRREVPVGTWTPLSDCYWSCVSPASGLKLVERRTCRYCNATTTVQLCKNNNVCTAIKSISERATALCSRYSERVRRLSGLGMQLSATIEDPDRACRVACQDGAVFNRFYLVNGEEGWLPYGADCARGQPSTKHCVSGRCVEFGSDDTPVHDLVASLPNFHIRQSRDVHRFSSATGVVNHTGTSSSDQISASVPIDFTQPVHVSLQEFPDINEIRRRTTKYDFISVN